MEARFFGGPQNDSLMPELRIDPVCGRRVYIAEDRAGRPSDFVAATPLAVDATVAAERREACPFCAGREAATPEASATVLGADGRWAVRVVPNKFPAVELSRARPQVATGDSLRRAMGEASAAVGAHEVIVESPRHLTDLVELDVEQLAVVLGVYRDRLRHWAGDGRLRHGIVFKNSGSAAGASLEHVHSQLVALPYVPDAVRAELDGAERFYAANRQCVVCDLSAREIAAGERLVLQRDGYAVVCAFAGRQPLETWILPERHAARFDEAGDGELLGLAPVLQDLLRRLHAVTESPTYNLILHTAPFDVVYAPYYHWHWELIPRSTPLAGLEWGAGTYINPMSPERAARLLRDA
jgi:UDPglucose--hexose-1-phosphate uridylyltransferase